MADLVEFDEYKGNDLIVLRLQGNEKRGVSFGMGKAKKALANIEEIAEAVEVGQSSGAEWKDVIITIDPDDTYPWEIKLSVGERILAHIEAIAEWVEKQGGQ